MIRFIDDGEHTGRMNMARDEALAASVAAGGTPAVRVYRFDPPCVTIGRFQAFPGGIDEGVCEALGIEIARRPTGGLAILHIDDFTYSAVLPREGKRGRESGFFFNLITGGVRCSLLRMGVSSDMADHGRRGRGRATWCFSAERGVDLQWRGRKICGSAQRIYPGSVLQHGSVFLRPQSRVIHEAIAGRKEGECPRVDGESPFVDMEEATGRSLSWDEVRDAFFEGFREVLGGDLKECSLTSPEQECAERLFRERYSRAEWLSGEDGGDGVAG